MKALRFFLILLLAAAISGCEKKIKKTIITSVLKI
jgi:hypothetical protein